MAFTYNAVSNRIFVDPDSPTEDLIVTLNKILAYSGTNLSNVSSTYVA